MDMEPFDELMGPPPIRRSNNSSGSNNSNRSGDGQQRYQHQTSLSSSRNHGNNNAAAASLITPDSSPQLSKSLLSTTSGQIPSVAAAPPSNAFLQSRKYNTGSTTAAEAASTTAHLSNIPDRWAQYERDSATLQQESALASTRAIAAAAERVAARQAITGPRRKQPLFEDEYDDDNNNEIIENDHSWTAGRNGDSMNEDGVDDMDDDDERIQRQLEEEFLQRHQQQRQQQQKETKARDWRNRNHPSSSVTRVTRSSSFEDVTFEEEDEAEAATLLASSRDVRAEALKVLEMAEMATAGSSSPSGAAVAFSFKSRQSRAPAALAGVDWTSAPPRRGSSALSTKGNNTSGALNTPTVHDLLDVDRIESRAAASRPALEEERKSNYHDDPNDLDSEPVNHNSTSSNPSKSWSSRYSVDHTLLALSGGKFSASSMLDDMDKEQDRIVRSARNMFSTSPHDIKASSGRSHTYNSSSSPTRKGLRGFSFKQHPKPPPASSTASSVTSSTPIDFNLQSHRTVWTDLDINGRSLDPVPSRLSWQEQLERKKLQRRRCIRMTVLIAILIIVMSILLGLRHRWQQTAAASGSSANADNNQELTFYVTSNVPFKSTADTVVFRDELITLPVTTTPFVVHLGNIQNSAVTLCPPVTYLAAKSLFLQSPVPMLVLPGQHDWNNCPFPTTSWETWQHFFGRFEENFAGGNNNQQMKNLTVQRPDNRPENFGMVQNNVLILGLHLVGGRIDDPPEWHRRHVDTAQFVQDQVTQHVDTVRAVVLLGNARPCPQTAEFFSSLQQILKKSSTLRNKPVAYIYANSGVSANDVYTPFPDMPNVIAMQAPAGGDSPLLRVTVGFGSRPISVA